MKKQDLFNEMQERTNFPDETISLIFDKINEIFEESIKSEDVITIRNFLKIKPIKLGKKRIWSPNNNNFQTLPPRKSIKVKTSKNLFD